MKYALVTGGSRGLGRAVCLKLAAQGLPVIINYQSNQAAAEAVKAEIEAAGGTAELMPFNVANEQEVDRGDGMMFMMPTEDWKAVLSTSLDGFYYVTRRCLPAMLRRKHGGRIVNMSSLSGLKGLPGQTNYSAAKAALIGATKALALEAAARDVTVNAVAPGFIETDMTKDLPVDELKQQIPMGRFGRPEEVAELVSFLLSDAAAYITGEVISINGGLYT